LVASLASPSLVRPPSEPSKGAPRRPARTESVFSNKLIDGLAQYAPTAPLIVRQSTEAVWDDAVTAPAIRLGVQVAYVEALTSTFIIGVPRASRAP
jgi:hypothetical protein